MPRKVAVVVYFNPDIDAFTIEFLTYAINVDYERRANKFVIKLPEVVSKIFTKKGREMIKEMLVDIAKKCVAYPYEEIVIEER